MWLFFRIETEVIRMFEIDFDEVKVGKNNRTITIAAAKYLESYRVRFVDIEIMLVSCV